MRKASHGTPKRPTNSPRAGIPRFTPAEPISCAGGAKRSSNERPISRRIGRNDVEQTALGDVAPFKIVRAHPVAGNDIRALLIKGGGDVGADKPCAARDHVHAAPLSNRPANAAIIRLTTGTLKEPFGAALPPPIGMDRHPRALELSRRPPPWFNKSRITSSPCDRTRSAPTTVSSV